MGHGWLEFFLMVVVMMFKIFINLFLIRDSCSVVPLPDLDFVEFMYDWLVENVEHFVDSGDPLGVCHDFDRYPSFHGLVSISVCSNFIPSSLWLFLDLFKLVLVLLVFEWRDEWINGPLN